MRHLGDVHYEAGRTTAAELSYREALALYRDAGRTKPIDLANAIRSMAVLKSDHGPVDEARALWQEAMELYAAANIQPGVAECTARLKVLALKS
jgi:tetratricopeptide (TPR) repeat protein